MMKSKSKSPLGKVEMGSPVEEEKAESLLVDQVVEMEEMVEASFFSLPKMKTRSSTTNTRKISKLNLENQAEPKINTALMEPI